MDPEELKLLCLDKAITSAAGCDPGSDKDRTAAILERAREFYKWLSEDSTPNEDKVKLVA